ncbi:MAG: CBS domain-containing protein [Hyphomicrobiales bacterium]|nr:CBS domain-containing protein [Hyphomicrobiales bacterium]MCP5370143.1 CBS domain-containing protein [Hyphomicrobiales bacterium]
MIIKDILKRRDRGLITNRPEDTIEAAAMLLASHNIGALPVRDGDGDLIGVISERDIVRGFAEHGGKVSALLVRDLMTRDVVVCSPNDDIKHARRLMKQRHIRHLPVVDDGRLCGMISSRDVMESRLEETKLERDVLRDYAIAR